MSQEEFLLKWNDHHSSFFSIVEDLCRTEQLCDVTLACGGQVFETHKLILSVCSPYFRSLLNRGDKHPIVYLKDVNPKHLEQLLSYMYRGEINVLQNDLGPLIETARGLQIKGLADAGNGERKNGGSAPKRTRTPTPAPTQAKLAKLEQSKPKSIEMTPELSYEPTTVDPGPLSVKQENNSQEVVNWGEDSSDTYDNIPNENYEQELQLEDEQYIQPDGLSGHQVSQIHQGVSLPPNLSLTPRDQNNSTPGGREGGSISGGRDGGSLSEGGREGETISPAVSPPSIHLQSWCALSQTTTQIFKCTYCNRQFKEAKELHIHVKSHHGSQQDLPLSSLERLSGMPRTQSSSTIPRTQCTTRNQPFNHIPSNQVYQNHIINRQMNFSHPSQELKAQLGVGLSFSRQRQGRPSELDPIQDTLKQLSRLAGGGAKPNQTSIVHSADSNLPIVHRDSPPDSRGPANQEKSMKSENLEHTADKTAAGVGDQLPPTIKKENVNS